MQKPKGKMGLFSCVALIVGACVGSAIFSLSGMTLCYAGPSAIVSWIVAALVYCAYGMLVAELSVRYPDSGGIYVFPRRAIAGMPGKMLAFVSGWGYIVSNVIAIAFSAIYAGVYLEAGFPSLSTRLGGPVAVSVLAAALSALIILIGGRQSRLVQNILVSALVATMLVFVCFAFFGGSFDSENFRSFFTSGVRGWTGCISAVPLALVAYGGCVAVSFLASEVYRPSRNVPRSLFIGLGAVALLYGAVIAAVSGTLPVQLIIDNENLRFIPLAASVLKGSLSSSPWLVSLISASAVLALLTTITALLRINSRAVQAMASEGFFPEFLVLENHREVPAAAVLVMLVIVIVLCFFGKWTTGMISLGAILNLLSMTITCAALVFSRKKCKERGFRAPLGLFLPIAVVTIFVVCCLPDIFNGGAIIWIFTLAILLLGAFPFVRAMRLRYRRISGTVVHGKGRGRIFGMPTANLKPYECQELPSLGVWSTRIFTAGHIYRAVTNVGLRPSDDDSPTITVESFIIDFDGGELYGRPMTVEFRSLLRPTMKFPGLAELKVQVDEDVRNWV